MIELVLILCSLLLGYSVGLNRKIRKDEETITRLLIEVKEKKEYYMTISSYLSDQNEDIDMLMKYLEVRKGIDSDADLIHHKMENILIVLEEAKNTQYVSDEARESIREIVKSEKKDPMLSKIAKKFIKWL